MLMFILWTFVICFCAFVVATTINVIQERQFHPPEYFEFTEEELIEFLKDRRSR